MQKLRLVGGMLLAIVVLFAGSMLVASEQGEEIVTLTTFEEDGSAVETRLWVVDDAGRSWLRAGVPTLGWLVRIDREPVMEMERAGQKERYHAVPLREPAVRDRIHALMREKYGFVDRWISLMRDGAGSVPVRVDPVTAVRSSNA